MTIIDMNSRARVRRTAVQTIDHARGLLQPGMLYACPGQERLVYPWNAHMVVDHPRLEQRLVVPSVRGGRAYTGVIPRFVDVCPPERVLVFIVVDVDAWDRVCQHCHGACRLDPVLAPDREPVCACSSDVRLATWRDIGGEE